MPILPFGLLLHIYRWNQHGCRRKRQEEEDGSLLVLGSHECNAKAIKLELNFFPFLSWHRLASRAKVGSSQQGSGISCCCHLKLVVQKMSRDYRLYCQGTFTSFACQFPAMRMYRWPADVHIDSLGGKEIRSIYRMEVEVGIDDSKQIRKGNKRRKKKMTCGSKGKNNFSQFYQSQILSKWS